MQLVVAVFVTTFGALIALKPKKTIDIQIAIYKPFNWKIEPIDMQKEIKNTRIMGMIVLVLGIISLVYILFSK
jgi:hypothetical protein